MEKRGISNMNLSPQNFAHVNWLKTVPADTRPINKSSDTSCVENVN